MGNNNSSKARELFLNIGKCPANASNSIQLYNRINSFLWEPMDRDTYVQSIYPSDIRHFIQNQYDKFDSFIQRMITYLYELVQEKEGPKPINQQQQIIFIRNIMRTLSRVIPILFEKRFQLKANRLLWDYDNPDYSVEEI